MTSQCRNLLHRRVTPNIYLVLAVSVGGHELVDIFREHQIADLAPGLDRLEVLQLDSVPELDSAILGASARGQKALLVRRPRDSLDRSLVLIELDERLRAAASAP